MDLTCQDCNKVFTTIRNLNQHKNKINKCNTVYACSICEQHFKNKSSLELHLSRKKKCIPITEEVQLQKLKIELERQKAERAEKNQQIKRELENKKNERALILERKKEMEIKAKLELQNKKIEHMNMKKDKEIVIEGLKMERKKTSIRTKEEDKKQLEEEKQILYEKTLEDIKAKLQDYIEHKIKNIEYYNHHNNQQYIKEIFNHHDFNTTFQNILENVNIFDLVKKIIEIYYKSLTQERNNIYCIKIINPNEIVKTNEEKEIRIYYVVSNPSSEKNPNDKVLGLVNYNKYLQADVENIIHKMLFRIVQDIDGKKFSHSDELRNIILDFSNILSSFNDIKEPDFVLLKQFYEYHNKIKDTYKLIDDGLMIESSNEDLIKFFREHIEKNFSNAVELKL